ncbi:hypothetical protein [Autumnicola musiva]|uniref:HEPN AbiU2-like domain-containing protein n=1 Tax=Autumnicola musiva TaxID=3075589 RepID=A0ABU3D552_9FLAO|nr:hypothetical protein [Zunongwangia sp. F117]MDT0676475.1 hypothetical protein [Zunongwangia sp. F117]
MGKKKEFEESLKRIINIYFSAQETFLINKELHKKIDTSDYESYLKNMNPFFYYCKIYFWRNTVIELSKLFNENLNDKFNIPKFISKLKPNGHFRLLKVDEEFLKDISTRIESNQHLIENLIDQRNKVYAHEDRDNEGIRNLVNHNQTEELLEIARDFIKELYRFHYKTSLQFDVISSPAISLKDIINKLCRMDSIEKDEETKLFNNLTK